MGKAAQTYLYQPRYFPPVRMSVQEISDYLDRGKTCIRQALSLLDEGAPLRARDLRALTDGFGKRMADPAVARELAHAGTYLPFSRWGELVDVYE